MSVQDKHGGGREGRRARREAGCRERHGCAGCSSAAAETGHSPSKGTPLYCFMALSASAFLSKCTSAVPRLRPDLS